MLWRPLRARRAGFMSLFLASIGLALVLRQVLLLAYGPQPQQYRVDPYKVYVIGSVRLSRGAVITIIAAAAAIVAIGLFLSRTTLGRTMRALADDRDARRDRGHQRRPRDHLHVDPLRPARRRSPACSPGSSRRRSTPTSASSSCCRSSPRSCSAGSAAPTARSPAGSLLGVAMELSTWPSLFGGVDPGLQAVVAFVVLAPR